MCIEKLVIVDEVVLLSGGDQARKLNCPAFLCFVVKCVLVDDSMGGHLLASESEPAQKHNPVLPFDRFSDSATLWDHIEQVVLVSVIELDEHFTVIDFEVLGCVQDSVVDFGSPNPAPRKGFLVKIEIRKF